MAKNPKFNNSDMFTGVNSDYSEVTPNNNSEVLATQGNVINSIKVFWNRLKEKLAFAITRDDTSNAVGGNYQPIYVNTNGGVQVCEPGTIKGEVKQGNIKLDEIDSPYPGQIVCINVTETSTTVNTNNLTINNIPVYYLTNVQVKVSDVIGSTYLFTYIEGGGDKWILNNKINVASTNNSGLMTKEQCIKLNGITEGANYFTYELPIANSNKHGGVKSSSNTESDNNQKIYHVGVDTNGIMTVNVPWQNTHNTALLRAGGNNNNNESTTNGNTYLKIVDGTSTSKIKVSGSGGTSVTSDNSGNITISSQEPFIPNNLSNNNKDPNGKYTVKGAGNNANQNHFLAGDGTWQNGILVPVPNTDDSGKILKCGPNGPYWATDTE